MIRAHTRSAAMVRAIARSRSQPLAARPSPRRTMREKLSITSKPSACGLATSNLQLLVPRSSAASGRGVRPGSADPVMVGVGAMGQADRLSLPTAARQGLPSALAESEALGLGVPDDGSRKSGRGDLERSDRGAEGAPRGPVAHRMMRPDRAAAMLGALALCACSSSDPQTPPIACPTAVLLDGADRTSAYRTGAERRPDNLRYMAALLNLASDSREVGEGIVVALCFDVLAERGAAVSDAESLEYFVAPVGSEYLIPHLAVVARCG